MTDFFTIQSQPTPSLTFHFERLTSIAAISEWARFEDPGELEVGDIVRVVPDGSTPGAFFDGQQFLIVRKPVISAGGWQTYTQPVHHTTFMVGS